MNRDEKLALLREAIQYEIELIEYFSENTHDDFKVRQLFELPKEKSNIIDDHKHTLCELKDKFIRIVLEDDEL